MGPKHYVNPGKQTDKASLELKRGDKINSITVYSYHFICGIEIKTAQGKTKLMGSDAGTHQTLEAPGASAIMAFHGSVSTLFETLGCYVVASKF